MERRRTTPIGEMWLEDGVLWHRIDTAGIITEDDARSVVEIVAELTGGVPVPSVVDIRSIKFASKEAREGFAGAPDTSHEIATALIVDSSSSRIMAKAFLKLSAPRRPSASSPTSPRLEPGPSNTAPTPDPLSNRSNRRDAVQHEVDVGLFGNLRVPLP